MQNRVFKPARIRDIRVISSIEFISGTLMSIAGLYNRKLDTFYLPIVTKYKFGEVTFGPKLLNFW